MSKSLPCFDAFGEQFAFHNNSLHNNQVVLQDKNQNFRMEKLVLEARSRSSQAVFKLDCPG